VHLGQLSVAHVRVHGRDAAGAPVRRDQRVEHGAVVGPVTGGLDDDVLVDAQVVAKRVELVLAGVTRCVLAFLGEWEDVARAEDVTVGVDGSFG